MTARNDGGQAFPGAFCTGPNDDLYPADGGMSLRDYLAGQALIGLTGGNWTHDGGLVLSAQDSAKDFAGAAYRIADAMLEAREK